ncbi:hypothetical protein CRG98_026188 [Punica granatum]|uniref:Uncharacterized protein n=1 Tax=Punica granatum TaxID=22663 RepID=A0A2I0JAW8_PUNGR|nr:hypothetical protein CRG98_026188 [Punica granatum]
MASLALGSAISKSGKFMLGLRWTSALFSASVRRTKLSKLRALPVPCIRVLIHKLVCSYRHRRDSVLLKEKAKQTAENASESAKETAQKAINTVVGAGQDT